MNIITLPLGAYQTNCYLVSGDESDTCVVIDPGYSPEQVLLAARSSGKRIEAVLLTHGHFDHVGGVKGIAQAVRCPVYLCEADLSMPESFTDGPLFYTDAYGEGALLSLAGLKFRVLHTPGHTPGSVCLCCGDAMFSGDTLFWGSCGRTDLPGGDWAAIRKSLQRLVGIGKNYTVYPGHGRSTTLDDERKYNPYMK